MGLPMGRDLEGSRNKLQCKTGAVCEEGVGVLLDLAFLRELFSAGRKYIFLKENFLLF